MRLSSLSSRLLRPDTASGSGPARTHLHECGDRWLRAGSYHSLASRPARAAPPSFQEPLVIAHHQLRFQLLHRVQCYPDHDQQRRSSEVEVRRGLVDQDGRQGRYGGKVKRPREREASKDGGEEPGGGPPWPPPGKDPAVFSKVVGLVGRV